VAIAQVPALRDRLRVCWEGADKSRNCGECEKCRRTYLNFLATRSEPGEFLKGIDRSTLADIKPRDLSQRNFIREIIKTAAASGIDAPWVAELRRKLPPARKRKGTARKSQPAPRRSSLARKMKDALAKMRRALPG
jgi:hypothetical protein